MYTMEEPFVPFTKPYGMSDEQFDEEVRIAQNFHDIWEYENQNTVKEISEEELWYEILKQEREQEYISSLYHYGEDGFCDGFTKY